MDLDKASRNNVDFWLALDGVLLTSVLIIDRPKWSCHPTFPEIIYQVDYGYLQNTSSMDGGGIDVWKGSLPSQYADAVICTIDLQKRDSEIKILVGCTKEEQEMVYQFHNRTEDMKGIMISR